MPIIGNKIGISIMNYFNLASNIVLGLVLIVLGVNLAINYFKKRRNKHKFKLYKYFIFSF